MDNNDYKLNDEVKRINIVPVRFKNGGKAYNFDACDIELNMGDAVIVDTSMGRELGFCTSAPTLVEDNEIRETKPIVRKATDEDLEIYRENVVKSAHATAVCKDLIEKHELKMQLVESNFTFDRKKLLFFFTADGRIDFRELVKSLAGIFKTRIELRQVGARDKAKLLGGIGPCGQELCCSRFLKDFDTINIGMAKDQGLSLNPSSITGICGRLKCCLSYEEEFYREKLKTLPKVKDMVHTPEGMGMVVDVYPIKDMVKVMIEEEDNKSFIDVHVRDLSDDFKCPCPIKAKRNEVKKILRERDNS